MTLPQACSREWDVAVIGAGPAGATAAREAARQGMSVLLVDKEDFPRAKVCGCCLNQAALAELETMGLGALPARLGGRPLRTLRLAAGKNQASIPLPSGMALSRNRLDAALAEEAVRSGASFLPGTTALLLDPPEPTGRRVVLRQKTETGHVHARLVLAADGLKGSFLQRTALPQILRRSSRIGAGTIIPDGPVFYEPGIIYMACGRGGYLGLVRLEDGRLDAAAAFDPDFVRKSGGPGKAAEALLARTGFPALENLAALAWSGTPPLTRRSLFPAGERLFLIGDAAGYVEPFTGEGIAWALASARAVGPLALQAVRGWTPALAQEWASLHRQLFARRQRVCRWTTEGLRHPLLTRMAVTLLARSPRWAAALVRAVNLS